MKAFSQQVTDNIPEFFFVWSIAQNKIIYISESNYFPRASFNQNSVLENIRNLIAQESRMAFDKMFAEINSGRFYQNEDFATSKSNKARYFNIKTYPVRDNGKITKVAGHVMDITRRIEKERKLEGESQKMEDIMHILAHDLRGPLGNIINLARIQNDMENIDEIKSLSEIIFRLGNETNRLITSMVELVELESESFDIRIDECNLQDYLLSIVNPYRSELQDKMIELITDFPDHSVKINLDLIKFRLVIQNLISNAVKFTEENGSVHLQLTEENEKVIITLKDDGIGIPDDKIQHLFEKFSSARRKGLRGEKSTGLGLSITKKIVDLHGGAIEVNSIVGDGTEFIIRLPKIEQPVKTDKLNA